jgi:hypothetical protein
MPDAAHQRLEAWVAQVIHQRHYGVFVTGQSLFTVSASQLGGAIADYTLPNYGDYGRLMRTLQQLVDAGRPVICLTGDVHWGRVVTSKDIHTGRTAFIETISSPVSLVSTVGRDQIKTVGAFIGDIFGPRNPWPRHANPGAPPAFLAKEALQGRFPCTLLHPQKGNHISLLRFRQHGGNLQMRVKYWPITRQHDAGKPVEVGPIDLPGM